MGFLSPYRVIDLTDERGQAAFDNPSDSAWFWIVVDGGTFELRSSRFSTSAIHFFDLCFLPDSDFCDPEEEPVGYWCPLASDYHDCGTEPPPEAGPPGRPAGRIRGRSRSQG